MSAGTLSVLLVDDHAVVREGYRRVLERHPGLRLCGEAGDAATALELFGATMPDVVVLDLVLRGTSGIALLGRMRALRPDACVILFSMYEELVYVRHALQAGARAYVTKASAPEVLVDAVLRVAAGERYLSPDVREALADPVAIGAPEGRRLSPREIEILQRLARGASVAMIADELALSPKTIANAQWAVKQKLGAGNFVQLLQSATRLGLLGGRVGPPGTDGNSAGDLPDGRQVPAQDPCRRDPADG